MAGKGVLPRARQDGLVIRELADETLVYDLERHKAHCLNQTAALIWEQCDGRTSVSEMTRLLTDESDTPVDEQVVWYALGRLSQTNLLREDVAWQDASTYSRRRLLGRRSIAGSASRYVHCCACACGSRNNVHCIRYWSVHTGHQLL